MTLPRGWAVARLGDVVVERVSQGEPTAQAVPYIDIGAIDRERKRISETQAVTASTAPTRARQWVEAGDVLVSMTRPNLNAVAQVPEALDGAVASTGFDVLRAIGVLPEWIYYRVRSHAFVQDVCVGVQGVVYPAIRPADVRRHELPVPPRGEQSRIVEALESYLSRLDAAVASLQAAQRKLKAYRASVLKSAVEGRLVPTEAELARKEGRSYEPANVLLERILKERRRRWEDAELAKMKAAGNARKDDRWKAKYKEPQPPDVDNLPSLPEGWCWATAQQVTLRITDGEHVTPPRTGHGVLLLSARNVRSEGLSLEQVDFISEGTHRELSRRLKVEAGDVLLSCSGTVGRTCVVPAGLRFSLVRSVAVLKPLLVDSHYLSRALASPLLQAQVHRRKKQTAQANIFQGEIAQLVFPLPPRDEQRLIVEEVERLDSLQNATRRSVSAQLLRVRKLRQATLRWAFEGRLVDQDPADESADVLLARIRAERGAATVAQPKAKRSRKLKAAS
ncbi:MAG: restriction endonuclease subunit S [Vicinamibacterales bacterium]